MTKAIVYIFLLSLSAAGISSCKTYSLSVDSFKTQFTKNNYRIDSITCTNKKGNLVTFENSYYFAIHITGLDHKKLVFSARGIRVNNDTVIGWKPPQNEVPFQTMPLSALETIYTTNGRGALSMSVPINSIKKITVVQ